MVMHSFQHFLLLCVGVALTFKGARGTLKACDLGPLIPNDDGTIATQMSATYNQGDEHIYVIGGFRARHILRFELATQDLSTVGYNLVTGQGAAVSTGGDDVYYFGGYGGSLLTSIYRWNSSADSDPLGQNNLTNAHSVANFVTARREQSVVFDPKGRIVYMFGGAAAADEPRLDDVVKFDVDDPRAETLGAVLPVGRAATSAVWDESNSVAYIFGGQENEEEGKARSVEILKFDPDSETGGITVLNARLPLPTEYSCAVWTGKEAYIIGEKDFITGQSQSQSLLVPRNIIRFTPDLDSENGGVVDPLLVEGLPVNMYSTACAYVEDLHRIYLFGGLGDGVAKRNVFYIDLDDSSTCDGPTVTTEVPTTPVEEPTSTTEDPTSTIVPTTEAPTTIKDPSTVAPTTEAGTTTEETTSTIDPPAVCNATDKYGTRYITTAGNRATAPCPGINSNGTTRWYCTPSGTFAGSQPDYSNCTNGWLPDIRSQLPDEGEALNGTFARRLLNDLQQNVDKASQFENSNVTYFGHEIQDIFQVGADILQATNVSSTSLGDREQLTGTTFAVYSKVLAFRSPWDELDDEDNAEDGGKRSRAATATTFINSSELSTLTLSANQEEPKYRKEFKGQEEFGVLAGAEIVSVRVVRLSFPLNPDRAKDSYIQVPPSWAGNYPPGSLVPFSGLRLEAEHANFLFTPPQVGIPPHEVGEGGGTILNGPLMAFTFDEERARERGNGRRLNFSEGVRITFRHDVYAWGDVPHRIRRKLHSDAGERPKAVSGSAKCAYWDPSALKWSTTGCALVTTGRDATVCECDHLTSFALIMDLHKYIGADKALEVITLILTPLSTLGFLAYILLFVYHRKKQRLMSSHPRNELTLGLCIALLVSNLLIMVTLDRGYLYLSEEACTTAAIALHYSLVCAFAWMGLEGVLLARLILVDVFSSGREYVRLERAAAFIVPALIVGATVGLDYGRRNSDGTPDPAPAYGGDAYCWLNGGYLWAFLGPVALVVTFNSIVLVLAVRKSQILQHSRKASITPPMKRRARAVALWLQGALNLTALMGITWVAGFFMLAENEMVARLAAYAFTLFNASQGIFIFGFHVAANKSIRRKLSVFTTKSTTASHGGGGGAGGGKGAGRENSRSEFNQSSKSHSNGTSGTKLHSSSKYY